MMQLTKYGMPGVWTHGFVDMWSPGYLAFMSSNHNGLVRMYETFGNGGATTMKRKVAPPEGAGQTSREWYRPLPPYKEVMWSMRNNTNYMQTAVLSALQYASSFPDVIVENFYRKSRNSVEAGKKEAPYAYIVPAGQNDLTRVDLLLSLLQRQGIEISKATVSSTLSDGTYAAGPYVIKRNQPYGRLVKTLLEKQTFPDPALRTYDDTGWTMGLMLQVEVKPTADKNVLEAPVTRVTDLSRTGTVNGPAAPATWVVAHHGSNDMVRLRLALGAGTDVKAARVAFKVDEVTYPAGSFLIPASAGATFTDAVKRLGLEATGLAATPEVATTPVDLPRLAMFTTWGRTQEVGWVRHAFDTFGIPYELIYKERIRKGDLRPAYDVILVPNQATTGKSLVYDVERKTGPLAYRKDPQFPTLGTYGETDDVTGGMGLEGVIELQKFVDDGGVLITLGASSYMPAEFGLLREVTAKRPTGAFYAPGPIVQAEILRAGASDLLRLRQDHGAGALRQRAAVPGARGRPRRAGADAIHGRRRWRAERADARRGRNPAASRHRGHARRQGPRRRVRHQSLLPMAEPRRVRDAVQCRGAVLERPAGQSAPARPLPPPRRRPRPTDAGARLWLPAGLISASNQVCRTRALPRFT